jgi:hypothetical protein
MLLKSTGVWLSTCIAKEPPHSFLTE